jgi:hypothetical protein
MLDVRGGCKLVKRLRRGTFEALFASLTGAGFKKER